MINFEDDLNSLSEERRNAILKRGEELIEENKLSPKGDKIVGALARFRDSLRDKYRGREGNN